ncbi:MAG: sugar ABC transporter substrate-binding protein, partial [Actinobacteria bacterium]|nr:sugar ABC transporter substrate-binding protein [Actinomycetota bacterium]
MKRYRIGAIAAFAAVALAMTGCSAGMGGGTGGDDLGKASGDFDWKRYDGQKISVMLNEHPWTDGVKQSIAEFEKATGITVDLKSYAEDLYFDKMNQALRTQNAPDLVMTGFDYSISTQEAAGLLEPLDDYVSSTSLTDGGYDLADYPAGVLAPGKLPAGQSDAKLYGIPISTETYILFYNKNLVDQYLGGKVPTTMDELIADSQKITSEGAGKVFGSVVRGVRSSAIVDIPTAFVINRWPDAKTVQLPYNVWFDGAWDKPRMTDPNVVQGLDDYAKLLAAGPPNRLNIDWPDANSLFSQGKVAFYADASVFGPSFEDPSSSKIAGKVGYATLPKGSADGASGLWSWGLSMSKSSQHKGAAWLFMQWFTNKANTAKLGALTGGPARASSATMPEFADALQPDFVKTITAS